MKYLSTKNFTGFPCTHRQWRADGHCKYVHGYSRSFYFKFDCHQLSKEGWVVDYGGLKDVKKWLDYHFDHTFLVSEDDPYLDTFKKMETDGIIQLRILPCVSIEGTARFVSEKINDMIAEQTSGRAFVYSLEVRENEKNSAIYFPGE